MCISLSFRFFSLPISKFEILTAFYVPVTCGRHCFINLFLNFSFYSTLILSRFSCEVFSERRRHRFWSSWWYCDRFLVRKRVVASWRAVFENYGIVGGIKLFLFGGLLRIEMAELISFADWDMLQLFWNKFLNKKTHWYNLNQNGLWWNLRSNRRRICKI